MAKAKKDVQRKVKKGIAPVKLSKEMKANIEKMIEKSEKQIDKKLSALKNLLEKLSGVPKAKAKKAAKKAKPAKAAKAKPTKAKKKNRYEKESETTSSRSGIAFITPLIKK
jgi:hypothetical protein